MKKEKTKISPLVIEWEGLRLAAHIVHWVIHLNYYTIQLNIEVARHIYKQSEQQRNCIRWAMKLRRIVRKNFAKQ